jgi:hypothetical protein
MPLLPILSQVNPVNALHIPLLEDPFYYYPHLHRGLPSGLCLSVFPVKTLYAPLLSPIHTTCSTHLILLDLITQITHGEQYRSFGEHYRSFGEQYRSFGEQYRSFKLLIM